MNSHLMLRLIDVALIILLGFISISRLKTEYIDLPSGGSDESTPEKIHESTLRIYHNNFELRDSGKKMKYQTIEKLESALVRLRDHWTKQKRLLVLTIEPGKRSIMQNLIDVLDLCERYKIDKNLSYD